MGELKIYDVANTTIAKRNIIVSPPEPPAEYLMADPTNSIYIGRTEIFNVPFHWTYQRLVNPHLCIVGTTGSGKSIERSTKILIRQNGKVKFTTIGEIVDLLIAEFGEEKIEDCIGVSYPPVEIYTFDSTLKGHWSPILFAGKKKSPEYLYKFRTASGREIVTTADHNIVLLKNGMIYAAKGSDVSIGDYIPLPRVLRIDCEPIIELDLFELLYDREDIYVPTSEILRVGCKVNSELKQQKLIRLKEFVDLLRQHGQSVDGVTVCSSTGHARYWMPSKLILTKEFARFLGYYVSEGMIEHTSIYIASEDKLIRSDIMRCSEGLGKVKKEYRKTKVRGIRVRSLWLVRLLEVLVGSGSENKRMPQFLLSTPEWFASEYLRAYYEGNGCVEKNCITAVTKSKELANDHLYLLLRLGIIGRMRKIFKKAANAPHHKGNWYYRITISGRELEKFVQIGFISPEKNAKLHELLKRKRDTNFDVIPEIREVVKTIYKAIRFERSSMTDSIARGVRRPSREYLKKLLAKIKERADEIRDARKEVEQLRRLPKLSQLVEVAEEKRLGSVLYREMDESWRRVKKGLVKTKFRNINRIATLVNEFCLEKEELRNYLKKVFSVIGIGLQTYDKSIYDFCYERRSDITYEKIEQAVEFAIQKYDELSFELSKIEKDIEFLELLANSDIFWDQIVSIEKIKSEHPYVYDLCVDDQVFLAGFGGVFVHNSYFIKTFLLRASLVWNANAIIIDWAGEYKPWVRQVGGKVVALARGAYLNLLDLAGMKPSDRIKQVIRSLEILTDIGEYPEQRRLIEQAMEEAYVRKGFKLTEKDQRDALGRPLTPPTLKDVQKILQEKLETGTYEFPAELENAIYKLKRFTLEGDDYFAEQSTIKLDELLTAGLVDIDLSGLPDETFRALGALTILQFIKEKMRMEGWTPEKGIRLFCLDGDEKITLANGKNVKIREAFERRMVGEKVWSFNNELKLEEDEIVKVMALPAPEKMYKIETEFGDALKVTPDHLMPVLRDGKVKWITSEEINVGDYLVCPRKINTGNELPRCIDLLKNARGVYIAIPNSPEIIKEAIKKLGGRGLRNCLKISKNRLKSLKKGAALKINEFEKIAKILGLSTQNVELRSRNKKVNLPEKLDECILYISGLIYSDGYIGKFGRIAFSNTDSGLKERFAEIVKKYGIKVSINRKEAVCGNNLLAELLKNITPEVLQSLPENLITAWLKGYADGDGSVSLKKKGKYTSPYITFSPSSFEEGELIRDLLLRIGIHSYTNIKKSRSTKVPSGKIVVSKELPLVIISGIENVKKFVEIVGFRQKERAKKSEIIRTLDNKSFIKQDVIPVGKMLKEMRMKIGLKTKEPRNFGIPIDNYEYGVYNPSRTMLQGIVGQLEEIYPEESDAFDELKKLTSSDLIFAKVVKKESYVPKDPFVYDIMTAKNHNFIANRIFSSNCVVDEAWKISKDENSDLVMIVREGRKYQFALIVASQSPTDIAEAVFSNVGTVFMLRLKFEKFLDYLQGSLRFSDYIRQKILSFGVGQCAVSMSYAESVPFSECFVIKKIEGEEPIIDYFVDIYSVLTEAQLRDETMPKSFPKEKVEFKKRLREMGLTDEKIEEIAKMIEKKARHIDAVDLVIELERRGVDRAAITSFYRELGIDDPTIVNIFAAADRKKAGGEITHVTIE